MFTHSIWIPLHSTNWTLGVPESTCYDENIHFESDCLQSQATRWLGTLRTIDWKELWYRAKRNISSLLGLSYGFWNLLLTMSRYSRFPYGPLSHPHRHNWYSMPQKAHFTTRKRDTILWVTVDHRPMVSVIGLENIWCKTRWNIVFPWLIMQLFLTTTLISFCLTLEASRLSHTHSQVWLDMTPMDS